MKFLRRKIEEEKTVNKWLVWQNLRNENKRSHFSKTKSLNLYFIKLQRKQFNFWYWNMCLIHGCRSSHECKNVHFLKFSRWSLGSNYSLTSCIYYTNSSKASQTAWNWILFSLIERLHEECFLFENCIIQMSALVFSKHVI